MTKIVKIITQTGSDISFDVAQTLDISLIPDIVRFGSDEYKVGLELSPEEFYSRMDAESELPTSSHPALGAFKKAFEDAANQGYKEIICFTVTSRMSGSYSTVVAAEKMFRRKFPDVKVIPYDSDQCSHGMAILVRKAAELAGEGKTADEIISAIDAYKSRVGFYFMLDSLKNAKKGGRVGTIKALTADLLGIKPLLKFENGQCTDFAKATSSASGMAAIAQLLAKEADLTQPVTVFHAGSPEKAKLMTDEILKVAGDAIIRTEYVGSVIGIYAGTGAVGIAFTKEADKC